jgi:hypothetical protein
MTQMSAQVTFSVIAASGVAVTTSTAIAAYEGLSEQLIAKFVDSGRWVDGLIVAFIAKVYEILSDPAALLHWTETEWAMLYGWLRLIAVALIHVSAGFH